LIENDFSVFRWLGFSDGILSKAEAVLGIPAIKVYTKPGDRSILSDFKIDKDHLLRLVQVNGAGLEPKAYDSLCISDRGGAALLYWNEKGQQPLAYASRESLLRNTDDDPDPVLKQIGSLRKVLQYRLARVNGKSVLEFYEARTENIASFEIVSSPPETLVLSSLGRNRTTLSYSNQAAP
jgi:hypothetical protein